MPIQIQTLTKEDQGRPVSIWFADGHQEGFLHSWSEKANLLIISQDNNLGTFSPIFADFLPH